MLRNRTMKARGSFEGVAAPGKWLFYEHNRVQDSVVCRARAWAQCDDSRGRSWRSGSTFGSVTSRSKHVFRIKSYYLELLHRAYRVDFAQKFYPRSLLFFKLSRRNGPRKFAECSGVQSCDISFRVWPNTRTLLFLFTTLLTVPFIFAVNFNFYFPHFTVSFLRFFFFSFF